MVIFIKTKNKSKLLCNLAPPTGGARLSVCSPLRVSKQIYCKLLNNIVLFYT